MRSSAWALLGYGSANVFALLTTVVLARLLVPADFGLIALALALLAVAHIVQDSGLYAALIVHRGEVRTAAASVMVFAPLVGTALYIVFFAVAPLAASFFEEPRLTDVVRVMALVLVLRAFALMPLALLERQMRFGPITTIEFVAGLVQAATSIGLAFAGAGVWSLVAGHLAFGAAKVVLAWAFSPIRPWPLEAKVATLRELMRYGRHIGAANLIHYGNANAQGIVVGRVLGATELGYYTIASRLAYMPVGVIGNVVGRGVFAALSRVEEDTARFRQIWLDNIQRVALLSTPAAIGLALVADPFVVTLLGDDWRPAIVPLQVLALNSVVVAFAATSGEVFQALRRPKLRVLTESLYLTLTVPALVVGAKVSGLVGVAVALTIVHVMLGIALVVFVAHLLDVHFEELTHALVRPALGWALMAGTILAVQTLLDDHSAGFTLLALVLAGVAAYGIVVMLFARDIVATMWISLRGTARST